jgi:hypothetical protein
MKLRSFRQFRLVALDLFLARHRGNHSVLFVVRNRLAKMRITLSAKYGVLLTKKRNCFSPTGTSFTSVTATAVALRGAESMSAISPKKL